MLELVSGLLSSYRTIIILIYHILDKIKSKLTVKEQTKTQEDQVRHSDRPYSNSFLPARSASFLLDHGSPPKKNTSTSIIHLIQPYLGPSSHTVWRTGRENKSIVEWKPTWFLVFWKQDIYLKIYLKLFHSWGQTEFKQRKICTLC